MQALLLNRITLVLAFVGMFIAGVLSLGAVMGASLPCGASHGCDLVATHPTSAIVGGIPNAYFGFLAYLLVALLTMGRIFGRGNPRKSLILGYTIVALGTLASLILTYISFAVIHATCLWCLSSTVVMLVLLMMHAALMQATPSHELTDERPKGDGILIVVLVLATLFGLGAQGVALSQGARVKNPFSVVKAAPDRIIPPDAHVWGDKDAKVTVVEFGDLLCPLCRSEYPKIQEYVAKSNGRVRYIFRHYPMYKLEGHAAALPGAMMAEVAADKNRFWEFVSAVYQLDHEALTLDKMYEIAVALGLDRDEVERRLGDKNDPAFKRGFRDISDGSYLGVEGTPAFFIIAPGVPNRTSSAQTLFDDLERPEYQNIK